MTSLIVGLVVFLGVHTVSIVALPWRDRVAAQLGEGRWKALYSVVALIGLVLVIYGYGAARRDPVVLYAPPLWMRHVTAVLMLPVFPMLFVAYFPGRIKTALQHPMLAAVKLWAFAHLLANGILADVLLFGGFLAWAVVDRISMKRRPPKPTPAVAYSKWNDLIALALGLAVYGVFVEGLHALLIGVPVVLPGVGTVDS